MYLAPSLLALAALSLFILSKIADYFLAKRPEVKWVFLAVMGSVLIGFASYIGLTFIIAWFDLSVADQSQTLANLYPIAVLVISASIILLVSSIAFKVINQMCWPSAITTNFISMAIITIAFMGSFALNDTNSEKQVTAKTTPTEQIIAKDDEAIAKLLSPN